MSDIKQRLRAYWYCTQRLTLATTAQPVLMVRKVLPYLSALRVRQKPTLEVG